MRYEILTPDKVNPVALSIAILTLISSIIYIFVQSKAYNAYFILGLYIISALVSDLKRQIQLKFVNILSIGLFSLFISFGYAFISFENFGALDLLSIILFWASSVFVSKSYTTLQEHKKNHKND